MQILISIAMTISLGAFAWGATLENVTFPDSVNVEGKELALNGMGMRKVVRFGFPVKVYVGGLYLEKKSNNSAEIIQSPERKRITMQFVRPVDRDALIESFQKGYVDNCQVDCGNKDLFSQFKTAIVNVRKDNQIILDISQDGLAVEVTGPNAAKKTFPSKDLGTNILALFINEKSPPTPEFRKALLGLD